MKAADPIETARLSRPLPISACPRSSSSGLNSPDDRQGGLAAHASWLCSPSTRRPNGPSLDRASSRRSLPATGKTFDSFEFDAVPMISKAQVTALAAGDSWLEKGANLLMFGLLGAGKSHSGRARPGAGGERLRVLFTRPPTSSSGSRSPPRPPARGSDRQARQVSPPHPRRPRLRQQGPGGDECRRADRGPLRTPLLLDHCEPALRRTAKVFLDQAMTLAAVDRLVDDATIFEMNVESYRCCTALERKRGPGRPPSRATIKTSPRSSRHEIKKGLARSSCDDKHARAAILKSSS